MLMVILNLFHKKKKPAPIADNGPVGQYFH
jgi:hypothetical protein